MSEPSIITPESHTTIGKVPRNLLIWGLLIFSGVGMTWYYFSGDPPTHLEAKEKMQTKLQAAAEASAQGNPGSVDEAAQAAETAKRARDVRAAAQLGPAGSPVAGLPFQHPGATPTPGQPLPASEQQQLGIPKPLSRTQMTAMETGEAERERATRDARTVVFDRSGEAGNPARAIADVARAAATAVDPQAGQLGALMAGMPSPTGGGAGAGDAGAQAALLELAKAQSAGGRPESRQAAQAKWIENLNNGGGATKQEVLTPVAPPGRYMVRVGKFMPAVLTREITSEAEGTITARSTENVYDSAGNLMIPMGSEFVGRYNSNVSYGQSRMAAAFTTLRLPNGHTFALPAAELSDALGRGGMTGNVDRHFIQSFGAALLMGVLADRVSQMNKVPSTQIAMGNGGSGLSATGQVFVDSARVELDRAKGIAPTITVPAGTRVNVEVVRDMQFPGPYKTWSK